MRRHLFEVNVFVKTSYELLIIYSQHNITLGFSNLVKNKNTVETKLNCIIINIILNVFLRGFYDAQQQL